MVAPSVTAVSFAFSLLRTCCRQRLHQPSCMFVAVDSIPSNILTRSFAGHNKWSQIKHKKAIKDVRRAKTLSKASRAIIMASRSCSGDVTDLRLQSAIAHAQSVQLPKERIQEAIQSYQKLDVKELESHRYDAMLPLASGIKVACVITAVTDNHKRTAAQVRAAISKVGGEMLPSRKLDFMFQPRGVIVVERSNHQSKYEKPQSNAQESQDDNGDYNADDEIGNYIWECAIEHGATNVEFDPTTKTTIVTCEPTDLWNVVTTLQSVHHQCSHKINHHHIQTNTKYRNSIFVISWWNLKR